ncbi:MAG: thiamine phosphate synthase, partial [bacterium]
MPTVSHRLLVVTDRHQTNGRPLVPLLQQVLAAEGPIIQIRERDLSARELVSLAREAQAVTVSRRAQLLINDRIDVALALE